MNDVEMIKVDSSNIVSVGWNSDLLFIEYPVGIYIYKNVSKALFENLLNSKSKGKFVNENIKGRFTYTKKEK